MKFFSVKSNASATATDFSTPPESPTVKTKEPRTSSSSAEGSADSGPAATMTAPAPATAIEDAKPPIPPPRVRRPGNSKLEKLKIAEGGGGGGGGGGGFGASGAGSSGGAGVLSVSDMILAPPPPPTNNEHYLKASARMDGRPEASMCTQRDKVIGRKLQESILGGDRSRGTLVNLRLRVQL